MTRPLEGLSDADIQQRALSIATDREACITESLFRTQRRAPALPEDRQRPDQSPRVAELAARDLHTRRPRPRWIILPTWAKIGFRGLPRRSLDDLETELTIAQGGHHEPTPFVRCIGLVVAPPTECDQLIQFEV